MTCQHNVDIHVSLYSWIKTSSIAINCSKEMTILIGCQSYFTQTSLKNDDEIYVIGDG